MANRLKFTFTDTDCILFEWDTTLKCVHLKDNSVVNEKFPAGDLSTGDKICIENHFNPAREIDTITVVSTV